MLSLALVDEIDRLLQDGRLSQREIAARLRVGRGTVNAIANGRRGLYGKGPVAADPTPSIHGLPPERCPRCGFKVYLPCLVCRTREYREVRRLQRALAATHSGTPGKRRRGRSVRARRPRRSRVA